MEVHSEHRALLKEHYLDRSIYFLMEIVSLCRFQHLARLVMYFFFFFFASAQGLEQDLATCGGTAFVEKMGHRNKLLTKKTDFFWMC